MPRADVERRVAETLAAVDLAGFERRRIAEISGGQQQRVALARALAPRPRVLLLDEPLSNLDPTLRERTRRELKRIIRRVGITTLFVTHEQEEAFDLGDRVAVINAGRLEQVGAPEALYEEPASRFVATFIGRSSVLAGTWTAGRRAARGGAGLARRGRRGPRGGSGGGSRRAAGRDCSSSARRRRIRSPARSPGGGMRGALRCSTWRSMRRRRRRGAGGARCGAAGRQRSSSRRTARDRRRGFTRGRRLMPWRRLRPHPDLPAQSKIQNRKSKISGSLLTLLLAWLVCYPLLLTFREALGAPGWSLRYFAEFLRAAGRVAGALGEPLDLARDGRALRGDRHSARVPLRAGGLPGPPRARNAGRPAGRPAAAGRRGRVSFPLRRERVLRARRAGRLGIEGAAVAPLRPRSDPLRPRLLDVRLLLPLHARRARPPGRRVPRGGRGPGREARTRPCPRDPAAARARARRRSAPDVHDVALFLFGAVSLRRNVPRDDDADRLLAFERRQRDGDGRDDDARGSRARGPLLPAARGETAGGGRRDPRHASVPAPAAPRERWWPRSAWLLAAVLLLPHATLLLVSFVPPGTWTIEAWPPVLNFSNWALGLLADRTPAADRQLSLDGRGLDRGRAPSRVLRGVARGDPPLALRGALETLVAVPWALPGTVFAVALAATFSRHAPWAGRFVLVGTAAILPLAYLVRNLPLTGRAAFAGLRQLDPSLDEAGASLGARPWRRLARITIPLLAPALAGRRLSRVPDGARRLRRLDRPLHLRDAPDLHRDPLLAADAGHGRARRPTACSSRPSPPPPSSPGGAARRSSEAGVSPAGE